MHRDPDFTTIGMHEQAMRVFAGTVLDEPGLLQFPDDFGPRGRIVLYTRVKSPGNTTVVHRWYRGGELQQSVRLGIQASVSDGYRTYSQLTINSPGEWRVEVRSADDDLLFEKSFGVR